MASKIISYKIILIGNSGVGKTSIFRKLSTGEFLAKNISTIGIDKKTLDYTINIKNEKKNFSISLFDTAGQEKFRAVTKSYFKESEGILLMYDITDKKSFDNVEIWINSIRDSIGNNSNFVIILIGNKLDLIGKEGKEREVTEEDAKEACEKFNMIWGKELSTKDITNIDLKNMFEEYVKNIFEKVGTKEGTEQKIKGVGKYKKKKKFCFI